MSFHPFPRLPAELRLMIWDYHARIPYDHHLIINIGRQGHYYFSQVRPRRAARFRWEYYLTESSWPLPLLQVNVEARAVALAANPDSIYIEQVGGANVTGGNTIYFNAEQNILHFDYITLHALEAANRDNFAGGNPLDPFLATLHGFENIRNISIPETGNFTLLKYLRQSALVMFGSPALPILRGVTYVEHQPALPGTANTCQVYIDRVTNEVAAFLLIGGYTHHRQREILAMHRDREIAPPRIQFGIAVGRGPPPRKSTMSPVLTWALSAAMNPADKGQGVRVPREGKY